MTARIVVGGGGLAGLRAGEALRRRGFTGALTGVTAEPLPPYDRAQLSTTALTDPGWRARSTPSSVPGFFWSLGLTAVGLDLSARELEVDDGGRIAFDGLVIATGRSAIPRRGGLPLRTMADAVRLRALLHAGPGRLSVIGDDPIGLEVRAAARILGWDVTGTEPADVVVTCAGTTPNTGWLSGLDLADGVLVDEDHQVLTDGRPVPGVVAVGGVVAGPRHHDDVARATDSLLRLGVH